MRPPQLINIHDEDAGEERGPLLVDPSDRAVVRLDFDPTLTLQTLGKRLTDKGLWANDVMPQFLAPAISEVESDDDEGLELLESQWVDARIPRDLVQMIGSFQRSFK